MNEPVLSVCDLSVGITRHGKTVVPVDDVEFDVAPGEILGLVGESGSGKSLTLKALLGLLPNGAERTSGELRFRSNGRLERYDPVTVRGRGMAMIFQEPMTALNPLVRVRDLIAEPQIVNLGIPKADARANAITLMRAVGIPDPERRARAYPHQLSGGLRQRVMIAMALAGEPTVLLCDEPTTALDVTIQDQILGLVLEIRERRGLAMVFVTHDLAVVSELCDRVAVMYAGRTIEIGTAEEVFTRPQHPYTLGLLESIPRFDGGTGDLASIGGSPPDPSSFPTGCRFRPRCPFARPDCAEAPHELRPTPSGQLTACIHPEVVENGWRSQP